MLTTHLSNQLALKVMRLERGAPTRPSLAVGDTHERDGSRQGWGHGGFPWGGRRGSPQALPRGCYAARSRRAATVSFEAEGADQGGAATGADLGVSCKDSKENLEGEVEKGSL